MNRLLSAVMVSLLLGGAGCAGAHMQVEAKSSRYAISMSPMVRDDSGYLHDRHTLEKVGTLHPDRTRMGFFYSLGTIFPHYDISDEVNQQVAAAGGEAVVGLAVSVGEGCEALNFAPFFNILPIWPGCVPVIVTGDIVRRRPPGP